MIVNIIVAYCNNYGIGKDNGLVWNIKSDMAKFKKLTIGNGNNAVIMGKNTFISLNNENGLLKRDNLILSKSVSIDKYNGINRIKSFNTIQCLESFVASQNYDIIWVIGGEQIYKLFLDNYKKDDLSIFDIKKIYITYINKDYECSKFFPDLMQYNKHNLLFYNKKVHNTSVHNSDNGTNGDDTPAPPNIYDIEYVFS